MGSHCLVVAGLILLILATSWVAWRFGREITTARDLLRRALFRKGSLCIRSDHRR